MPRPTFRAAALLLLGAAAGFALSAGAGADPKAPPAFPREEPPYRSLDANLFVQTAAEYRACCLQAFNLADARLRERLRQRDGRGKPPAVVLDLDETVLDNAGFQAQMIRSSLAFDQRLWDRWEEKHAADVGLVPGARDFVRKAKDQGVALVYITNRTNHAGTRAALDRLEIGVPDDQLLVNTDPKSGDKTGRRKRAAERFDVLLFVGDNLRDFDEAFKYDPAKGVAGRKAVVDAARDRFGADWIILPNPAYGEWTKPLGKGAADADLLAPVGK